MRSLIPPVVVWFRRDLRLSDHAALNAAVGSGGPVIPAYIMPGREEDPWAAGGASLWWLHMSLKALTGSLEAAGSRLVLRRGPALESLRDLIRDSGARGICWQRCYEPAADAADAVIREALAADGIRVEVFGGDLLFEPSAIRTGAGGPFRVFTPFWRACRASPVQPAEPARLAAGPLHAPLAWPASLELSALGLEPVPDWAGGLLETWQPGEAGALIRMERFLHGGLASYGGKRDLPAEAGTSRLSPHLHFGEISPRTVWNRVLSVIKTERETRVREAGEAFLRQLGWREFSRHLMHHLPQLSQHPLRQEFERFPWRRNQRDLEAWQRGLTGYPLVDAGMRELRTTGWMHNRVRMVTASFLTKHLMINWIQGARWFWDTLVDADLANNSFGWQWTAGCGADAAPFFRVFNPVAQGEKFDPAGEYVRRWVPEISGLPTPWIHKPWQAPGSVRAGAGIRLGASYPRPIVDHGSARERALAAYREIRAGLPSPPGPRQNR